MRPNSRVSGMLLAVSAPLWALSGCTGTDVLTSGSGEFEFRTQFDNVGGRFVDNSQSDQALMIFRQVEARPLDPAADASLGETNLALLAEPYRANFVSGIPGVSVTPQTSGEYRLVRLIVDRFVVRDVDDLTVAGLSDPVSPTCHDFIKNADLGPLVFINASDLPAPVIVSLDANNSGRVTMRVDYPGFLAALNASLDCASCGCPAAYVPNQIPRSCLISGTACAVDSDCPPGRTCEDCTCPVDVGDFEGTVFQSMASTFLSFE